jgi:hypothetical protein
MKINWRIVLSTLVLAAIAATGAIVACGEEEHNGIGTSPSVEDAPDAAPDAEVR